MNDSIENIGVTLPTKWVEFLQQKKSTPIELALLCAGFKQEHKVQKWLLSLLQENIDLGDDQKDFKYAIHIFKSLSHSNFYFPLDDKLALNKPEFWYKNTDMLRHLVSMGFNTGIPPFFVKLYTNEITKKNNKTDNSLDKKLEPINYQVWALYENFDAFTAAALWCGQNPYYCYSWSEIEYIEVRNLIIHILKYQLDAENYPIEKRNAVVIELGKRFDVGRIECMQESFKFIISREQLMMIAIKVGVKPGFLFGVTVTESSTLTKPEEIQKNKPEKIAKDEHIRDFIESIITDYPKATSKDIVSHCFDCYKDNNSQLEPIKKIIAKLNVVMGESGRRTNKAIKYMEGASRYKPTH